MLFTDLYAIATQVHVLGHYFYEGLFSLNTVLNLTATQLFVLLRLTSLTCYAHACILMATLGVVIAQLIILKLSQLRRMLLTPRQFFRHFRWVHYAAFLRRNNACLLFIASVNCLFSRALSAYLLVNCPLNCVLMAVLLFLPRPPSTEVKFFTIVFMIQQWVCTVAIHLQEAALNERLHRPSRRMLYLVAEDRLLLLNRENNLQLKVKIANYIAAFHVKQKYGITYFTGSLITMMSFAEVNFFPFYFV